MKLEEADLDILADETIHDEVLVPIRRAFFLYTGILVGTFVLTFRIESKEFLFWISVAISFVSALFHFMIYRHEKDIILNLKAKVMDFQQLGEMVASCVVHPNNRPNPGREPNLHINDSASRKVPSLP